MTVDASEPDTTATPPGPEPHRWYAPLRTLRDVRGLLSDGPGFVAGRFAEYGDLYRVDEGGGAFLYVLRHPDMLRELLVTRARDFQKRGGANDRLVPVIGDGLLTADGDAWKEQRRLLQPRFHRRAIEGYAQSMLAHAERIDWEDGATIDVSAAMMRLTLDIVVKALFDHDIADDADTIGHAMQSLQEASQAVLPDWVPTPSRLRGRRALSDLHALIDALCEERLEHGLRDDMLSMLLDVGMERALLRDELVTFFLAGHETTSHTLSWTWWLLANHPDVEARLHAELDEVLGDRRPTLADETPYLDAVIAEVLRLYPTAPALPRVARVDTELGGYPVPAGSEVVGWIWHCHRDPRWFDAPEDFRPERFLEPAHPRHAYLPFGAGPRMCIGSSFARLELRMLLMTLARRYRLHARPGQTVRARARVTLAPDGGLPLRVEHRRAAPSSSSPLRVSTPL